MTNFIGPFTSVTDEPVDIDADYVAAVTTIPVPGVGFWTGVWPLGVYSSPIIIKLDPATFLLALSGLGKTYANFIQADGAPVAILFGQGPPAGTVVERVNATSVNGNPLVSIYALDLDPWVVEGTVASVTAAITPPPFPPSGSGRVILEATIDPAGNILAQQSDLGILLAPTAPHVPGAGYFLSMTGAVPPNYTVLSQSPAQRMTMTARQVAGGSPDFVVALWRTSRTYAAGRVASGGGMLASLNLNATLVGPNTYQCVITTPQAPGTFAALATSEQPDRLVTTNPTGPNTFDVTCTDLLGAPATGSFAVSVSGIDDGTGNQGFEPLDDFFQIVVIAN